MDGTVYRVQLSCSKTKDARRMLRISELSFFFYSPNSPKISKVVIYLSFVLPYLLKVKFKFISYLSFELPDLLKRNQI